MVPEFPSEHDCDLVDLIRLILGLGSAPDGNLRLDAGDYARHAFDLDREEIRRDMFFPNGFKSLISCASFVIAQTVLLLHDVRGRRLVRHFVVEEDASLKTLAIGHLFDSFFVRMNKTLIRE